MKNILITTGPTNEYIDKVMKITNMSSGETGIKLAEKFLINNYNVTLILSNVAYKSGLYEKILCNYQNLHTITIETTSDLKNALINEQNTKYTAVIHAAAVADYKCSFIFNFEELAKEINSNIINHLNCNPLQNNTYKIIFETLENPKCKIDENTKIKSTNKNLALKLDQTEKIIASLKPLFKDSLLIGFKLLYNSKKEQLFEVAKKLCEKNKLDYVIANDLYEKNNDKKILYVVDKNGFTNNTLFSIDELFDFLQKKL